MFKKIMIMMSLLAAGFPACSTLPMFKTSDGKSVFSQGAGIGGEIVLGGTVIDRRSGKPVKDASVEIKNSNLGVGYYLAKTDGSGSFTIRNFIPHIQYSIEVTAAGYVTYLSTEQIGKAKKEIYLDREAVVSGVIKDSSGAPISGADIRLDYGSYNNYGKPLILSSAANGSYVFSKLKQGSYTISCSAPGYIPETLYIKDVKEGAEFSLPIVIFHPASISGKISISGLNVPAANVDVIAKGRNNHSASTYQDGSFKIDDVKPGAYQILVQHQGFNEPEKINVTIKEGESKTGLDYSLDIKPPEVQVYSYRYTFAPGNDLTFDLRTFRLESVNVSIYAVPVAVFLRGSSNPDSADPQKEKFKRVVHWDETMENFEPYEWLYRTLKVKDPLPTGGYCIEVKGAGSVISRKYFTVTSVGVVVKRSEQRVFAYVTNLVTNEPVRDASVAVFENTPVKEEESDSMYYKRLESVHELPVKILSSGKTGSDGIYQDKVSTNHHLVLIALGNDGSYAICNTGSASAFQREKDKYMIYTDRPVYRSGDTVFYKIIGKERKERFIPQSNQKIYYKIRSGRVLAEGRLTLDEWGTAAGSVVIDESAGLGRFAIEAGPSEDNTYDSGYFYVEQYRKPEYKVEIVPARDYFINGDDVEFRVEGKYFFGAPVKGAMVSYYFYEKKLDDNDSYWWEDEHTDSSYNKLKLDGVKYLDDNGVVSLKLAAGNFPYDREITLEASVVDRSNVSITERKTVRVGRGEFYIKINPKEQFFKSNEKKTVEIKAVRQNGEPVKADIKIELFRYIWKPYQRVYVHESKPRYSEKVTTDSNGDAVISLPNFADSGEYDIVATAADRRNNRIIASRVIWVYTPGGSGNIASKFKNLELVVNQKEFSGDGEITCLLKSRYSDGYACVTIEGRDIYQSKVVKLTGNITPVVFKVSQSYAPNFYVSAAMQYKRALYTASQGISIPVKGTILNVSIKPEKEKYRPGDTAFVTVSAVDDNGKPVMADLSLGAVDEAIYSVRRDHTPKMSNFFYARISNWVLTSYSYPITLLAGAGKDSQGDVRQDFKDTAFWQANIKTNASGKANVSFKLPDNLTTWRLTARGHDREGRVGENKETFIVTQDLIARIAKPRFMIEGDSVAVLGIVNSNTERGLTGVKTDMKVNGKTLKADKEIPISLPAFASESKSYTISVPIEKELSLRFDAEADSQTKDAIQLPVGIERRGSAFKLYGSGDLNANKTLNIEPLHGSGDFEFVPESVSIMVNPSPLIQMIRSSEYLVNYPYGCVEQTVNSFMPVFALNSFLKKHNLLNLVHNPDEYVKKINDKTVNGIKRIENSQNSDGTWGWWAGGEGNAYLTAYVMESLWRAKKLGCAVDSSVTEEGLTAAARMLSGNNISDNDAKAYLLYISSLYGRFNRAAFDKLRAVKAPGVYASAYIMKALAVTKETVFSNEKKASDVERNKYIAEYMSLVKNGLQRDAGGIYWQSANRSGWQGGKAEMTATVLGALVDAGDTSSIPSQAVSSISKRSLGGSWLSTKETSVIIYSILDYMERSPVASGEPVDLKFTMDGREIAAIKYDPKAKLPSSELVKNVKLNGTSSAKTISITASGSAGADAGFEAVVSGTLYFKPSGIFSVFKSEERGLASLSNGISMYREFASLTRVLDVQRKEYLVPAPIKESASISVGDEILVKLRFKAQDDFEFLALEDYLPSGFEVVNEDAYGSRAFSRSERRDNRMVYFFSNLKKGETCEIAYIIRAELAGKFMARPARMECMYEPSIQGWSVPVIIEVKEK
ncbi:MAG: carboxypeptidase regulatory-like domain-containing protein [Spirochaetia bacterium]|nr:carboxypeptidase regulatory-like domain-containing protein [Spirochaetia bacterium]